MNAREDIVATAAPEVVAAPAGKAIVMPFQTPVAGSNGVFLPGLLLAVAVLGILALQTYQYALERQLIGQRLAGSQAQVDAAQRARASLDKLAVVTQKLAVDGNPNARALVDELQRRGVTIDPTKLAPAPSR